MPGFSISLLLLPRSGESGAPTSAEILSLLDAKADTPGWKWTSPQPPNASFTTAPAKAATATSSSHRVLTVKNPDGLITALKRACEALVAAEPEITRMDTIAGDGDCGTSTS